MKSFTLIFALGVLSFLAAGAKPIDLAARGADDDCDSSELGNTSCVQLVPGCAKTYKKCLAGAAGDRDFICSPGTGGNACFWAQIPPNNSVGGENDDEKSDLMCAIPEV